MPPSALHDEQLVWRSRILTANMVEASADRKRQEREKELVEKRRRQEEHDAAWAEKRRRDALAEGRGPEDPNLIFEREDPTVPREIA